MYLVVNGGVILLGFGATRWTNDFAQKYIVYAFSVGIKLFVMQLLIGLGEAFIRDWAANFEEENTQVLVLIGAALVMLVMVARIPDIVAGLINGVTFSAGADELKSTANTVGSLGGAAGGAARMVGGNASSATGHGLAARAATNLASTADQRGLGRMGAAFRHYASAFGDDLAGQFSGDPGRAHGKRGWRIRRDLQQCREALESEGNDAGNTIGPGGSHDKGGDSNHPAPATGAEHGGRDDGGRASVHRPEPGLDGGATTDARRREREEQGATSRVER
jgi:type IV secretion system protein TrbL